MSMVERVARAAGCQMDHCWDRDTDRCSVCLDTARAAIAAMPVGDIHGTREELVAMIAAQGVEIDRLCKWAGESRSDMQAEIERLRLGLADITNPTVTDPGEIKNMANELLGWPAVEYVLTRHHHPPPSEHQSAASPNTDGQPKAGGLQNRECLGAMDDPEHATGEKI